jgi:hypothetical protein
MPDGYTDPNTNNNTASVVAKIYPVYNLSGYVRGCQTNGPAIPFVNVTLSGTASGSTLTDTNGFYVFSNLVSGTYTITPTSAGNLFSPTNATLTVSSNTTAPVFLGSIGQIRGKVSYSTNGTGIPGIYLKLTGAQTRTEITDANGIFCFTNTPPGSYTITPVVTNGFVYAPTNAAITIAATNCVGQANFVAQQRTLQLVALEVIQVIQDWSNSVVLIKDKETWVRAHLQLPSLTNPPVLVAGARLYGTGAGGGALPGSPLPPFNDDGVLLVNTNNAAAARGQFTNSLNFRLPSTWLSGTINLQFVATNNLTVIPTNTVPANSTVTVSFTPSRPLPLLIIPVNWQKAGETNLQQNSAGNLADLPRRLLSIFPVPSVTSDLWEPMLAPFTAQPVQADYNALNRRIAGIRDVVRFFAPDNRLYHGAVARGGPERFATGEAPFNSFVSSALMPNNADFYVDRWLRHLASHELGHNFGRQHDVSKALFGVTRDGDALGACDEPGDRDYAYPLFQPVPPPTGPLKPALGPMLIGTNALVYGLDTLTRAEAPQINPIADPNADFDVMGYCDHAPLQWWISSFTYPAMLTYITNTFLPPPPPPPPVPARRWWFLRGSLDFSDNTGTFLALYAMTTTSGFVPPTPVPGIFSLRLYDSLGNLLDVIPFTPEEDVDETLGGLASGALTGSFDIPIPVSVYPAAVARVELWENGSQMLATESASASPPQFTSTLTATQTASSIHLAWSAINAVAYAVQYSTDGGTNWFTLILDWPSPSYDLDPAYLHAGSNVIFRVIATDGFDSTDETSSGSVNIPPHPPSVMLNAPLDGSRFIGDQQIFLDASANDMQDGPLTGASVQWTSSRDGQLGQGTILDYEAGALSEGRHLITVTATDSLGLTNSASVTITVLRQLPPALAIQLTGSQVLLSWPSSVTNYLLESATSLSPAAWSTVTNAPAAADITQTVSLNLSTTNRFFRLRMP